MVPTKANAIFLATHFDHGYHSMKKEEWREEEEKGERDAFA
jgi:hypothetical protein